MKRLQEFRRRVADSLERFDAFDRPAAGLRPDERRGSTLVVVISLLGALLLLGILVLTLASSEQVNAEYFADAAKDPQPDVDPDAYFDTVLRQLIIGPGPSEKQSALYGGRWSLLANMVGDDVAPFNGRGVNVVWDRAPAGGAPGRTDLDMDNDGVPDANVTSPYLQINDSPAATGAMPSLFGYPNPDVGYTYPDINNPFLQYDGMTPTGTPTVPGPPFRVILPSFHRPQYLRGVTTTVGGTTSVPVGEWYTHAQTARRVFRLHKEHVCIDDAGAVTAVKRVYETNADAIADGLSAAFPLTSGVQGPWTMNGGAVAGTTDYSGLDVDTDGDGVNDAVLLDLGLPPEPVGGGRFRIPLVAVSIKSADALFNLNTTGNITGAMAAGALQQTPFGGLRLRTPGPDGIVGTGDDTDYDTVPNYISRSHTGAMPYEVNPQWGLSATSPLTGSAVQTHNYFFGHDPANYYELANMEWWFLTMGAPVYGASATNVIELNLGRNSGLNERSRLLSAVTSPTPKTPSAFCGPGVTGIDDNKNGREGYTLDPRANYGSYRPLDFYGAGQTAVRGTAQRMKRMNQFGQMLFTGYDNYGVDQSNAFNVLSGSAVYGGLLMRNAVVNHPFSSSVALLVDDQTEMKIDPRLGADNSDAAFPASESEFLQLPDADVATAGITSRVEKLAPINFKESPNAAAIRKLYTPVSWDLKSFGKAYYGTIPPSPNARIWEYTADPSRNNRQCFPPLLGATQTNLNGSAQEPFRPALRGLLLIDPQQNPVAYRDPQARFSVNHVVEYGPDNRLRFRPPVAHPINPGGAPILGSGPVRNAAQLASRPQSQQIPENIQSVADQEWLARRDRQFMARDIYVMLYTLCGGNDNTNYALTSNNGQTIYGFDNSTLVGPSNPEGLVDVAKANQCKIMAQFAVNLVDQLDGDDIMTAFEYDVDLSDGWGLGDDPFITGDDTPAQLSQRRVVYGLEEQQLALSEGLAIWAKRVSNGMGGGADHTATEWDDTNTKNWLFFELQNVSPRTVDLSGQAWQVAVLPNVTGVRTYTSPVIGSATITGEERRLTFTTGVVNSARAGTVQNTRPVFSVKTDSEADLDMSNNVRESNFTLNPHHAHATVNPTKILYPLAPRAEAMEFATMTTQTDGQMLDLINGWNQYRINRGTTTNAADGNQLASTSTNPASKDLVHIDTAGDPDAIDETYDGGTKIQITLELRRRLNPWRVMPDPDPASSMQHGNQSNDNPWVVVDKMDVPLNVFSMELTDTYTNIRNQLLTIASVERGELLNRKITIPFVPVPPMYDAMAGTGGEDDWMKYVRDSVGQRNYNNTAVPTPAYYSLSQTRFDRMYGSVVELFNVALYGPEDTTFHLVSAKQPGTPLPAPVGAAADNRNMLAGSMFLYPRPIDPGTGNPISTPDYTNRWFRLLEFVETPSRWHWHNNNQAVAGIDAGATNANPIGQFRKPGLLDLNNLHAPQHLAGLLDDRDVVPNGNTAAFPYLTDSVETAANGYTPRDWWYEFLLSRDGRDPLDTNQILPGLPPDYSLPVRYGSRPFLSVETSTHGAASIEDTVYRALPTDLNSGYNNSRRLFEIGARNAMGGLETVDPEQKHLMLGKVVNNTTNRSNTFFVFIRIDFYEAAELNSPVTSGAKIYRIGARRSVITDPPMRGFYVVDRTKAMEMLRPADLPKPATTGHFSFDQSFNYKSLILHGRVIQ